MSIIEAEPTKVIDLGRRGAAKIKPANTLARATRDVTRVISVTSGKGGVGKTNTVVNLAIALSQLNKSVLVLDADLGLANVDVLLGIRPRRNISEVFEGTASIADVLIEGPEGISIIPATSGQESICHLSVEKRMLLINAVEELSGQYDYLLIDTPAGIGSDVMYFNSASSEIICVITAEPTSVTDAYALIKVLSRNYGEKSISILLNNVSREELGFQALRRLERAVQRYLNINLKYLGLIPADMSVQDAIQDQAALTVRYPSSPAALAISSLARKIDQEFFQKRLKGGLQFFFRQLLESEAYGR